EGAHLSILVGVCSDASRVWQQKRARRSERGAAFRSSTSVGAYPLAFHGCISVRPSPTHTILSSMLGRRTKRISSATAAAGRVWGWAHDRFGTPEQFFLQFFVVNYCPLAFIEDSGKNYTPDRLPAADRQRLFAACDAALMEIADAIEPRAVVGIGGFAERRAR